MRNSHKTDVTQATENSVAIPRRKRKRSSSSKSAFVLLPNAVLRHPPIQHRGKTTRANLLTPFEFAVAVGCLVQARTVVAQRRHEAAYAAGGEAIADHRETPAVVAVKLGSGSGKKTRRSIPKSGRKRYRSRLARLRLDEEPQTAKFEIRRSALLRASGLSTKGANQSLVLDTLNRLKLPVGGLSPARPVLSSWRYRTGGELHLRVSEAWLPTKNFARVPLPLLTNGANGMALYLLLWALDLSSSNRQTIEFERLIERLGIPKSRNASDAWRTFVKAFANLQKHLGQFDLGLFRGCKIEIPAGLEFDFDGDRFRFYALSPLEDDDEFDEFDHDRPPIRLPRVEPTSARQLRKAEDLSNAEFGAELKSRLTKSEVVE